MNPRAKPFVPTSSAAKEVPKEVPAETVRPSLNVNAPAFTPSFQVGGGAAGPRPRPTTSIPLLDGFDVSAPGASLRPIDTTPPIMLHQARETRPAVPPIMQQREEVNTAGAYSSSQPSRGSRPPHDSVQQPQPQTLSKSTPPKSGMYPSSSSNTSATDRALVQQERTYESSNRSSNNTSVSAGRYQRTQPAQSVDRAASAEQQPNYQPNTSAVDTTPPNVGHSVQGAQQTQYPARNTGSLNHAAHHHHHHHHHHNQNQNQNPNYQPQYHHQHQQPAFEPNQQQQSHQHRLPGNNAQQQQQQQQQQQPGFSYALPLPRSSMITKQNRQSDAPIAMPHHHHHYHHHHHHQPLQQQQQQQPSSSYGGAARHYDVAALDRGTDLVPRGKQPAQSLRPCPSRPLVVLLLGFRGSGKTTQGTRLAEKYNLLQVSSGAIYTEGKKPFIVLPDILKQHFGPSGSGKYNGVLLDRFIAASEMDAYYVTYCLRSVGMPIPMVFFLDVDPDVGMERASERRDNKDTKNSYWRLVEQRVQLTAVETIFRPSGCVTCIDCNRLSEEDAFAEIVGCVESQFPRWPPCHALIPPNPFKDSAPVFRLVDDFAVYEPLAREVHRVIDSRGRTTSAPLSTIGGYVDRSNFTDKHKRNLLTIEQVTMKIDGQRFLVALDRRRGAMAFPFMFSCCYQIDELFAGAHFAPLQADGIAPLPDSLKCTSDIEVLLDTEVLLDPFTHKPVIYVIDTIFFYGERVAQIRFEERYKRLTQWFREMHERADSASAVAQLSVVLKTYVPINELGTLLPRLEDAPVPIDGIVFQPNDMYHYAQDKRLLKWKPKELCTADFRLSDATPVSGGCKFSLLVSYVGLGGKSEEVPFPLAEGFIDSDSLASNAVGNSSIVELSLRSVENVNGKLATQWVFSRDRSDKPAPNRYDVVSQIIELEHLTYPELVSLCAGVNYVGAYKH